MDPDGRPESGEGGDEGALPPLLDSHLHLTSERFDADRAEVLRRAVEARVVEAVTVASDVADAGRAVRLAERHADPVPPVPAARPGTAPDTPAPDVSAPDTPALWATAGVHPHEAAGAAGDLASALDALGDLLDHPRVVAVGETGLDFHYMNSPADVQLRVFRAQCRLGLETDLPVVVHSREAVSETAEVVRDHGADGLRGVLHCFTGGRELLEAALEADWYVSFSGIATFGSFDAGDELRDVPADRLLVETDAPYLAPVPERGGRNEPALLRYTVEAVARLRGEAPADVARRTRRNARRLFRIGGAESASEPA